MENNKEGNSLDSMEGLPEREPLITGAQLKAEQKPKEDYGRQHVAFHKLKADYDLSDQDTISLSKLGEVSLIGGLLERGFGVSEIHAIYSVRDHNCQLYDPDSRGGKMREISISLVADFAEIFLGTKFSDDELADAIEKARDIMQDESLYNSIETSRKVQSIEDVITQLRVDLSNCIKTAKANDIHDLDALENFLHKLRRRGDSLETEEGQGDF